ncbi:hypothetical protein M409DRAFT_27221 [Zasmidium cellare ATCC 36951]|uniref:Ketoreductase (KR) domain-containing protein n=1 Tax=Zasmidium cellare ATCC 36951 TaxID=1080233 RepID=A0A6A6C513_ZASCE|nr:uncharacterized protein M409DRAFT_27221 [Zasmidium cellare ATCC 36951]KAF2162214.1 hypothetical protein M409DRAFT_27221 [Zasmidium cellare ATCC 36951]
MAPAVPLSLSNFWTSQRCVKLPIPTKSFAGKTVIVTGSNSGMGLEAARHIVRLGAEKTILAVRSLERGQVAAQSIQETTHCSKDAIEVWQVDLADYSSIKAFAERANTLRRLDVVVENAGTLTYKYQEIDGDESCVRINTLGTLFMALTLLPKLRATAEEFDTDVVLTFNGSWMHWTTDFPEQNAEKIFEELADEKSARMAERYPTSKLILLLAFRQLHAQLRQPSKGHIITSYVNPGGVATDITREMNGFLSSIFLKVLAKTFLRTAEEGGRTLVHAAEGGRDTDGKYLDDCRSDRPEVVSPFVTSERGEKIAVKVWKEVLERFESVQPGISKNFR